MAMDQKKQLIVIGALGVVLLGIGTMQFVKASGGNKAAATATAQATPAPAISSSVANASKPDDPTAAQQQNDLVKGSYPERNPFKPLVDDNPPSVSTTPPPTPQPNTRPLANRVASGHLPFSIDKSGSLPVANVAGGTTTPVNPPAPEFGYKLAGIIVGRKPAAVFIDAQGAQHLVELGGRLDGDTQLVDLDREHVVLRVKDQTKNLTLGGGDSSAK